MFDKLSPEKRAEIEAQQLALLEDFQRRMAEAQPPKTAIEIAEAYGVDIEQLRWLRTLTPLQRLQQAQSLLTFVLQARAFSTESRKDVQGK